MLIVTTKLVNILISNYYNLKFKTMNNITWLCLSVTCYRSVGFLGKLVSSTNKTDRHDITEILLKVALNTIKLNLNKTNESNEMIIHETFVSASVFLSASNTQKA